jgi:hypothetical protein
METKLGTKRLNKNKMAEFGASFGYEEREGLIGNLSLPQPSSIRGWLQSRQQLWHQRDRG